MAQDTRKDPRAKVLTMTVRYKSATVDEFIEHHSHDVSRGGMFIKTPSPFPPGTLLKFEVKIAEDQKVMQGVGRVVWKREAPEASGDDRPAGMGVKFIKIDEESKRLIDQLVTARGDGGSAFEAGEAGVPAAKPTAEKPPEAPAEVKAATPIRKATMIGLGAISQPPEKAEKPEKPEEKAPQPESFFPETESEKEMPAPEDRTVMRQAAELLQDALREAGGSLEEVGSSKPPEAKPEPEEVEKVEKVEKKPESEKPAAKAEEKKPVEKEPETKKADEPAASPARGERQQRQPERRPAAVAKAPVSDRAAAAQPAESGGGGGKAILWVLVVGAVVGGVYYFTRPRPPAPAEQPSAQMSASTPPSATESAANVVPEAAASAAAADASAAAAEAAAPSASASASAKPAEKPVPPPVAVKKPAVHYVRRKPKPKPTEKPETTAKPKEKPQATAKPKAQKPAKPKPKKPAQPNDNPY